jgi:hypothetical protein
MSTRALLELFGWVSSGLIVLSLAQGRVWRFRVINFVGAFMATIYNAALSIWPFAAMNLIITVLDAYWLVRLRRERNPQSAAFHVLEVGHDDAYFQHFVRMHGGDARTFYPAYDPASEAVADLLVLRGDEVIGAMSVSDIEDGVARVSLDYVTQRFRDSSPGKYLYSDSGLFHRLGADVIELPASAGEKYLRAVGFREQDGRWTRAVPA